MVILLHRFISVSFKNAMVYYKHTVKHAPPYHPSILIALQRIVYTVEKRIKLAILGCEYVDLSLCKFSLAYRYAIHSTIQMKVQPNYCVTHTLHLQVTIIRPNKA